MFVLLLCVLDTPCNVLLVLCNRAAHAFPVHLKGDV